MSCCSHPVINQGVCDICFTKKEEIGFGFDPNCGGIDYARGGGYATYYHWYDPGKILTTTFLKSPVNTIGNRLRATLGWLIVMAIACFVARFMRE